MKFATIAADLKKLTIIEAPDLQAATRSIGLDPMRTDHGLIRSDVAIVVFEFSLFVPVDQQSYFGLGGRLYAGNAVLYAFGQAGETIDIGADMFPEPRWFANAHEVEQAIRAGEVKRPRIAYNDQVLWQWPEPVPPGGLFTHEGEEFHG